MNGKKHGYGVYTGHGCSYEGNFIHDKRHGKGKLTDPSGAVWTGDFEDDQPIMSNLPRGVYRGTTHGRYNVARRRSEDLMKYADWGSYASSRRASVAIDAGDGDVHPHDGAGLHK